MAEPWCTGEVLVGSPAEAPFVALLEPVSFWGGVDDTTGTIIDPRHRQRGLCLAHTAVLIGASKGSSSSGSTFLECVRRDTAPAILLLTAPDPILVVAAAAAHEIYGRGPTVLLLDTVPDAQAVTEVRVELDGAVYARAAERVG